MTINITQADIDNAVWETNSEVELRADYSGRGMYGKDTWAVVGESRNLADFETQLAKAVTLRDFDTTAGVYFAESTIEAFVEVLNEIRGNRREDSMGMSMVWYYPSIKVEE